MKREEALYVGSCLFLIGLLFYAMVSCSPTTTGVSGSSVTPGAQHEGFFTFVDLLLIGFVFYVMLLPFGKESRK